MESPTLYKLNKVIFIKGHAQLRKYNDDTLNSIFMAIPLSPYHQVIRYDSIHQNKTCKLQWTLKGANGPSYPLYIEERFIALLYARSYLYRIRMFALHMLLW
jgi:hypothetical protein